MTCRLQPYDLVAPKLLDDLTPEEQESVRKLLAAVGGLTDAQRDVPFGELTRAQLAKARAEGCVGGRRAKVDSARMTA